MQGLVYQVLGKSTPANRRTRSEFSFNEKFIWDGDTPRTWASCDDVAITSQGIDFLPPFEVKGESVSVSNLSSQDLHDNPHHNCFYVLD